jgi:hypothetical protein
MRRLVLCTALAGAAMLLLPAAAAAQAAIAGAVKDTTGAVLPGVTVEASSPALIERVRAVQTDEAGNYRIIDLRPGTYTVVFTLQGFRSVRRTDVLLEGAFTATVDAELQVGAIDESVTVSGTSPVVDVVNNRQTFVVNREMLDAIPTARSLQARANLIPATTVTPGGMGQTSMTIHGSVSSDQVVMIDGMRLNNLCGSGQFSGIYLNDAMAQEITYDTGAQSAEVAQGGLRVNMIPKEGGNTFSGSFFAYGANGPMQSDNRSDEVKQFITQDIGLDYTYEINPSFGGPIKRDRLWFYFTYKYSDNKSYVADAFFPDGSPAFTKSLGNYSAVTRVTWQATGRDKLRFYLDRQYNGGKYSGVSALTSPEASHELDTPRAWTPQVKWTQTTTNRLMLEAGITLYDQLYDQRLQPTVGPRDLPHYEITNGRNTVAGNNAYSSWTKNYSSMASATYVTGSHALKAGMTMGWGTNSRTRAPRADITQLRFFSGAPAQVVVRNTPLVDEQIVNADFGLYVQDSWTMNRLTLNVGGRYDHFNAEVPAQSAPAGNWVAARAFDPIKNVPNWHDFSLRLGGTYDLSGDGKTAVKVNASRYVASEAAGYAATFNPMSSQSQTRTWNDADKNGSIYDANGNVQKNEVLGGTPNFGLASGTSRPDGDLKRGYNWEYGASLQHEIFPRVSVTAGYHRRNFYNLRVSDNLNLSPGDWSPFTITVPNDSRLPDAGKTITMYTLNAGKVGTPTDTLVTYSTLNTRVYNGVDINMNARLPNGAFLMGGIVTERTAATDCDVRDNANSFRFCDNVGPFRTAFKMSGAYPLPYDFQLSGSFIARPGGDIDANYTVTSAIAGRTIIGATSGTSTIGVGLIEPNTMFLDDIRQLDMRIARTFRVARYRIQGLVDIYNVLNAGTVTTVNQTFGSNPATNAWLRPTSIMNARYVRLGVQVNF